MHFDLLNLFRGLRHDFDLLTMLRGENHMEVLPEGYVAIVIIARGSATITRPRMDVRAGRREGGASSPVGLWLRGWSDGGTRSFSSARCS